MFSGNRHDVFRVTGQRCLTKLPVTCALLSILVTVVQLLFGPIFEEGVAKSRELFRFR